MTDREGAWLIFPDWFMISSIPNGAGPLVPVEIVSLSGSAISARSAIEDVGRSGLDARVR